VRETTFAGNADAYLEDIEFLVRYRFPRPVAGAMVRVVSAPCLGGLRTAARDCAGTALKLLAAIQQSERRARGETDYVVVPDARSLRDGFPPDYFVHELAGQRAPASRLLAMAGEPGGGLPVLDLEDLDREALLETLAHIACLADYRLLIPGPWSRPFYKGAVVLLGSTLNFFGEAVEGPEIPQGQPLLCDPRNGRLLNLSPLLHWEPGRTPTEGALYLLSSLQGPFGIYDEVGRTAAHRLKLPLHGTPHLLQYPLPAGQTMAVHHPPGRYRDDHRIEPHYEIHGVMYRGGVTDIYRGTLLKDGTPIVLKTFEDEAIGENKSRFMDEVNFGTRASHPAIIEMRRARHQSSHLAIELEFAAGGNLADRLHVAGVLDPWETLTLLIELCDALDAIHSAGIIHLDLKPENILFTADHELRLIDFSISVTRERLHRFLRPGAPVGTPGYIPPERRDGKPVDPNADLWQLGVLLSRMLLGIQAQTPEEIPGPPQFPQALGDVLRRLLEPEPAARYQTAPEVLDAYRAAVAPLTPLRCAALDLEGTLLTTAFHPEPRPGLREFAQWCLDTLDRVYIYTAVESDKAAVILELFRRHGHLPKAFVDAAEIVEWPCGADGSLKDLRLLRLPLRWVVLLDDMRQWVVNQQLDRWVRIAAYDEPRPGDAELEFVRPEILKHFDLD